MLHPKHSKFNGPDDSASLRPLGAFRRSQGCRNVHDPMGFLTSENISKFSRKYVIMHSWFMFQNNKYWWSVPYKECWLRHRSEGLHSGLSIGTQIASVRTILIELMLPFDITNGNLLIGIWMCIRRHPWIRKPWVFQNFSELETCTNRVLASKNSYLAFSNTTQRDRYCMYRGDSGVDW